MSGTSGSLGSNGAGISLPVPKISLVRNPTTDDFFAYSTISASMEKIQCSIVAQVAVLGFSDELLNNIALYQPQLELMRYTRRTTVKRPAQLGARSAKSAQYVHPSNMPVPSGTNSNVQGGIHNGTFQVVHPFRQSEWPVTTHGQVVDLTQSMFGYMTLSRFTYRDNILNVPQFDGLTSSRGVGKFRKFGKTFPYSGAYFPGYFNFRWSIIDPLNPRGRRISGPISETLTVTNNVFPLIPDVTDIATGKTTAILKPSYVPTEARIWLGSRSRLPR